MLRNLLAAATALAIVLAPRPVFGAATIFSGSDVKALKQNLSLNGIAKVLTGTADPTSVAQNAPQGSIYLRTGASGGTAYLKQDAGSSTNWSLLSTGAAAGNVSTLRMSLSGGVTIHTTIDGVHRVVVAKTIDRIEAACANSGASGSTTFQVNYGPELATTTSVTLASDSSTPNSSDTNVNIALSPGDLVSVDVTGVASGLVEDCSVELIFQ